MAQFIYSPKANTFFMIAMQDAYTASGTWPTDGVEVSDEDFQTFAGQPPDGKTRGYVKKKLAWVNASTSVADMKVILTRVTQTVLDQEAEEQGFMSMDNAVTFADETSVPDLQAKALALRAWRSQVWALLQSTISSLVQGTTKTSDIDLDEFKASLPAFTA